MEERLKHGSRKLPLLSCGDTVVLQDLQTNNGKPGRWTKSGEVVEVLPYDAYLVRIHGSRGVTQRNRRFLRKLQPFSPAIPFTSDELSPSRAITRAMMNPPVQVPTPVVKQASPALPTPAPTTPTTATSASAADCPALPPTAEAPAPIPRAYPGGPFLLDPGPSAIPPAELHRQRPIGPPGGNLIDLLKQKEQDQHNP